MMLSQKKCCRKAISNLIDICMNCSSIAVVSQVFQDNKSLKNQQNDKLRITIPTKAAPRTRICSLFKYAVILQVIMENIK